MPTVRLATPADVPALRALVEASVRGLSVGHYTPAQIESALRHALGVDTQLIADGTYWVVEAPDGGLAAAGGWSARRMLYGSDALRAGGDDAPLDPAREPARIRAFVVHPAWARQGLGRLLFTRCMEEARAAGFRELELGATLPGVPLYLALGFTARERIQIPIPDGPALDGVRMTRPVDPPEPSPR